MGRLLLIIGIAFVAWYVYRQLQARSSGGAPGDAPASPPPTAMAKCAECGVHTPDNAGVRYQNLHFCSPEHLNAWLARHGKP